MPNNVVIKHWIKFNSSLSWVYQHTPKGWPDLELKRDSLILSCWFDIPLQLDVSTLGCANIGRTNYIHIYASECKWSVHMVASGRIYTK